MNRITFRYEGGPLTGRIVQHALLPTDPAKPTLHRHTTCPKGSNTDMVACGLYHLEQKKLPDPFPLPPEPPEDASDEVKQQMMEAREKAAAVFAQSAQYEWVAVHHKSDEDQDWHKLEVEQKEEAEPSPPVKPPESIRLPDDHPIAQFFAKMPALTQHLEAKKKQAEEDTSDA